MIDYDLLCPELQSALRAAGWYPERRFDITQWVTSLQQEGYVLNPPAEKVLSTLGGLVIEPVNRMGSNFSNDEPFSVDPVSAGAGQHALALEIGEILGGQYFPIGEWLSYSTVFIEFGGNVVAAGLGWIWGLGDTFESALELAICAHRPLVCLHSDPGLDPWPR
ncbi:SUKH-3 domain-containing protein [Streptomyces longwoodensis]|uniref:SUKH-3 domain-containing protein n=1 Tax=Streptomyces longwoodensis TaxID=68231 RepID=UPI0033E5A26A